MQAPTLAGIHRVGDLDIQPRAGDFDTQARDAARRIDEQRLVVDSQLTKPARWSGRLRRDIEGGGTRHEHERYAATYDSLVPMVSGRCDWRMNTSNLCRIHRLLTADGVLRDEGLRVGRQFEYPAPSEIRPRLEALWDEVNDPTLPPAVQAAVAHLGLVEIHPFGDGNGRTARLVASLLLSRADYCSTLSVAVEHSATAAGSRYIHVLDLYLFGVVSRSECVAHLVHLMEAQSLYGAWFLIRERQLRERYGSLGLPVEAETATLIEYDLATHDGRLVRELTSSLGDAWPPLRDTLPGMAPGRVVAFWRQIATIRAEDRQERLCCSHDPSRP